MIKTLTKATEQTKVHTRYFNCNGDRLPGVTTVLGVLDKPALMYWAWQCGMNGQDFRKVRDTAASIGTIAHLMVMCHLSGKTPDLSIYSQADIDIADNCLLSFYEWEKTHKLEPIYLEVPLASDVYGYGGTPDFFGRVNGELELIDFKTSKAIYDINYYQLAAYRQMIKERGYEFNRARVLRIGRDANEGFEERLITSFNNEFLLFKHCLDIYNLLKVMKRKL